jgi:hypothetical protein
VAGKRDPLQNTIDRLYGLPLDEFTPARDAAAKERRAEGDREGAEALKRLRKPNRVAWALNRVRWAQGDTVQELLAAGERLQAAQRQLVGGGGRGVLRDAAADERRLVGRVADLAAAELGAAGHVADAGVQSKLFATLHAAAANAEVRALLAEGRLLRDHELSDLGLGDGDGLLAAAPAPTPRRQPAARPGASQPPKRRPPESSAARRAHERKVRALADRLERARADHAEQVQRAGQTQARADEAERAAGDAARASKRAEAEAKRAQAAAKQATVAAERAGVSAEKAARSARQAADTVGALEADLSALTADA